MTTQVLENKCLSVQKQLNSCANRAYYSPAECRHLIIPQEAVRRTSRPHLMLRSDTQQQILVFAFPGEDSAVEACKRKMLRYNDSAEEVEEYDCKARLRPWCWEIEVDSHCKVKKPDTWELSLCDWGSRSGWNCWTSIHKTRQRNNHRMFFTTLCWSEQRYLLQNSDLLSESHWITQASRIHTETPKENRGALVSRGSIFTPISSCCNC